MPSVRGHEIVIDGGRGAYLWDDTGRRLFDAPASLWYCNVGHGREEIARAVAAQVRRIETYSTFRQYATRPALDLAEWLAAVVPVRNPKVFLTSGGSDAVDTAAKLARLYWNAMGEPGKQTIVTRELAYHGLHGFGTSICGIDLNHAGYGPLIPGTARVATNDAGSFESLISTQGADTIAAFFCEPIIGTGGVIPPAPGYLHEVQHLCRQNDILFVVDEVITGFGRTGYLFAAECFNLDPDMLLLAKGITSGYMPLGAAVISERVWRPFWEEESELVFRHGLTYAGHATACAAALANLDIIEREALVERARSLAPVLERVLRPFDDSELVTEVRAGVGLLAGIQMQTPGLAEEVARLCLQHGVVVRVITNGTLQISPPFVSTQADLAMLADVLDRVLQELPLSLAAV